MSKDIKDLVRALRSHNPGIEITRTGSGHIRVKMEGLMQVIISNGNADANSHRQATRDLLKKGYKL